MSKKRQKTKKKNKLNGKQQYMQTYLLQSFSNGALKIHNIWTNQKNELDETALGWQMEIKQIKIALAMWNLNFRRMMKEKSNEGGKTG